MNRDLHIAVVSAADPLDRRTWSGSTFFMTRALQEHVGTVEFVGPLKIPGQRIQDGLARMIHKLTGRRIYPARSRRAARHFARKIRKQLSKMSVDLVFAPAASIEIAGLDIAQPIIYASDATFALMRETYPIFSAMGPRAVAAETSIEQAAIAKADLLLYPSQWAARSAVTDYQADPERIRVVPFGANLDRVPDRAAAVGKSIEGGVRILFLAKEWHRKGGDTAVATLHALREMGISAELVICGVTPPHDVADTHITVVPYLDKNVPADRQRFEEILETAHILLLPTEMECFGIVFCEANAYGMPVFSRNVGGVPSVVRDGENGYLLPPDAGGEDFARAIAAAVVDPDAYAAHNRAARNRYETVLNWNSWGRRVGAAIKETLTL